ncbi:MAG: glycosyltransferase family 4 protein [Cyanobacteria bacterium J06555_13]
MKRLKILLSAYACRPYMGSEPGVGWNLVQEIAKHHDVWVLTRVDNQPSIEAQQTAAPLPGVTFVYCDLPGVSLWKRGLPMVHLHYYLWQIAAYQRAKALHPMVSFDLAHHLTYVRHSSPSFLSLLPIPFIWGPVGGGESAPKAFWQDFGWRGRTYETLRALLRQVGENDPFVRMTARRSAIANATTQDTARQLKAMGAPTVRLVSQVGISEDEIAALENPTLQNPTLQNPTLQNPSHALELEAQGQPEETAPPNRPIRFVSIGRLLHWKGFHLGLRAFAQAQLPDGAEYWVIGTGAEQARLEALAESLGIGDRTHFLGNLPRDQVLAKLDDCFALVHPSLHESGGFVCLEAMAKGRPVLCLDLGGPALQVTAQTGIKVVAQTPDQVTADLASAMTRLAKEASWAQSLGANGKQRVKTAFSWGAKGAQINQLYQEVCGGHND